MRHCRTCTFETARLLATPWDDVPTGGQQRPDLAEVVKSILTAPVTRSLPPSWQGAYTRDRAQRFIRDRDRQGANLLVVERATGRAVGLLFLFETPSSVVPAGLEVRLGYALAEFAWGRGLATELVGGLVTWCRGRDGICCVAGGVAIDNPASKRVLAKCGFTVSRAAGESGGAEEILRVVIGAV